MQTNLTVFASFTDEPRSDIEIVVSMQCGDLVERHCETMPGNEAWLFGDRLDAVDIAIARALRNSRSISERLIRKCTQ